MRTFESGTGANQISMNSTTLGNGMMMGKKMMSTEIRLRTEEFEFYELGNAGEDGEGGAVALTFPMKEFRVREVFSMISNDRP